MSPTSPVLSGRPLTREQLAFTFEIAPAEEGETVAGLVVKIEPWAPPWVSSALQRIKGFLSLEAGWDSYGGQPLSEAALRKGLTVLGLIEAYGLPAPFVAPTSPGGLLFEWQREEVDAQLEVGPLGEVSLYVELADGSARELPEQEDVVPALEMLSAEMLGCE